MRKDSIISFRISSDTRRALKDKAKQEHRSVSSLLEVMIEKYLCDGHQPASRDSERRRFPRRSFQSPALVEAKTAQDRRCYLAGTIQDISLNGLKVVFPYGEPVNFLREDTNGTFDIILRVPGSHRPVNLTCDVRRLHDTGEEYQIGAEISNAEFQSYQAMQNYLM
ncbi:MAG: PilZ domain-containing protein [Desulfohalobiaceae bacterium]